MASAACVVTPATRLSAVGQVENFAITVWDGTCTKMFCPLMPEAW